MAFLSHRRRRREWMDAPDADADELRRSLGFIRRINWALGYTRATIKHLERFSRSWKRGERIDIIDLATGSADIPRAILKWSDRKGFDVHIVGIDLHPVTVQAAEAGARDPRPWSLQAAHVSHPLAPAGFGLSPSARFPHHPGDTGV